MAALECSKFRDPREISLRLRRLATLLRRRQFQQERLSVGKLRLPSLSFLKPNVASIKCLSADS